MREEVDNAWHFDCRHRNMSIDEAGFPKMSVPLRTIIAIWRNLLLLLKLPSALLLQLPSARRHHHAEKIKGTNKPSQDRYSLCAAKMSFIYLPILHDFQSTTTHTSHPSWHHIILRLYLLSSDNLRALEHQAELWYAPHTS
jgi:hypothetical protein